MAKKKPGPKPTEGGGRVAATTLRSTDAWKEWVEEFTLWDRSPSVSDLVDRALIVYARERRYPVLPPKR
jgi:hypothetical protein